MSLQIPTKKVVSNPKNSPDTPVEAKSLCSQNLCLCVRIIKNENIQTPSQLTPERRQSLLRKFLRDLQQRWRRFPIQILMGKRSKKIVVHDEEEEIDTTPFFLQFGQEVKKLNRENFDFQVEGLDVKTYFVRPGWKGPDQQKMFLLEYGYTEVYAFDGVRLEARDAVSIMDPKRLRERTKNQKAKKPTKRKNMKRSHPIDFENLSNIEIILELEAKAGELEESLAKKLEEGESKDEEIERLQKILRNLEGKK